MRNQYQMNMINNNNNNNIMHWLLLIITYIYACIFPHKSHSWL